MKPTLRIFDGSKFHYPDCTEEKSNHYLQIGENGIFFLHNSEGVFITSSAMGGILQYSTPFKDKNGKQIFDGDVIGDWDIVDEETIQSKLTVFYHEEYGQWMLDCSLKQDKSTYYALFKELQDFEYEVIGNIYTK